MGELSIESIDQFLVTAKSHINSTTPDREIGRRSREARDLRSGDSPYWIIMGFIEKMREDKEMIEEYNELKKKCGLFQNCTNGDGDDEDDDDE